MKKQLITIIAFISLIWAQDSLGTPYVEVYEDTVLFGINGMYRNCGALFEMDVQQEENIFTIAAVDTGDQAWCFCTFDVWVETDGVAPGDYTARFYSYDLLNLVDHDTVFIGELPFTVETGGSGLLSILSDAQSDCGGFLDTDEPILPNEYVTLSAYPNPFNPTTTITFDIPKESYVTLTIYDMMSRRVNELVSGRVSSGKHSVIWNGTDANNNPVASGMYLYQLKSGDFVETKKLLLLK